MKKLFVLKAQLSLGNYLTNIEKHLHKEKEFYHLFKSYSIANISIYVHIYIYMSIFSFFFFCYNVMYVSIKYLFDLLVISFVSY